MNVKAVVKVMNFHALLRVEASGQQALMYSTMEEELSAMIEEQGEAQLTCQFCDKVYHFTKEELKALQDTM